MHNEHANMLLLQFYCSEHMASVPYAPNTK
jgi:hypothetical protein